MYTFQIVFPNTQSSLTSTTLLVLSVCASTWWGTTGMIRCLQSTSHSCFWTVVRQPDHPERNPHWRRRRTRRHADRKDPGRGIEPRTFSLWAIVLSKIIKPMKRESFLLLFRDEPAEDLCVIPFICWTAARSASRSTFNPCVLFRITNYNKFYNILTLLKRSDCIKA